MLQPNDPQHNQTRTALRAAGLSLIAVGLVLTIIGIGSFFAAFGTFEPPRYFWCAFLGLPLMAIGKMLTVYGYLGSMARYVANEAAPVGVDVVNYTAEGTQDAVRNMAAAVGQGLRSEPRGRVCPQCRVENDAPANYCKACGAQMPRSKTCAKCGDSNPVDARFCDHCGVEIT